MIDQDGKDGTCSEKSSIPPDNDRRGFKCRRCLAAGYKWKRFRRFHPDRHLFIASCLILMLLTVFNAKLHGQAVAFMLSVFSILLILLIPRSYALHNCTRWMTQSEFYKARVQSHPSSDARELQHAEWDSWGGVGAGDTTVYLVLSPEDALARIAKSGSAGNIQGIPCPIYKLERLERGWYLAYFYTDTYWPNQGKQCSDFQADEPPPR